jgi:hypothetical protein
MNFIICANYAFGSRLTVRDCELKRVIERLWFITISNRRQQLSVESVFADLSTTVQIRFFFAGSPCDMPRRDVTIASEGTSWPLKIDMQVFRFVRETISLLFYLSFSPFSFSFFPPPFSIYLTLSFFVSSSVFSSTHCCRADQSEINLVAAKTHLSAILLINERSAGGGIRES